MRSQVLDIGHTTLLYWRLLLSNSRICSKFQLKELVQLADEAIHVQPMMLRELPRAQGVIGIDAGPMVR